MAYAIGMAQEKKEVEQFINFIQEIELENIMEIGTKLGGMFYMLCRMATGMKISVDMVDGKHGGWILKDHPYLGEVINKRDAFFKTLYDCQPIHMVHGDSHRAYVKDDVRTLLGIQKLDLLFIDGDHTYEGAKKDYESYKEYVKKGGLIVFHDINDTEYHRRIDCNVHKLWKELKGDKIEFNVNAHWAGIGVLIHDGK